MTSNPRPVPTFDHLAKKKPLELRDVIVLDQEIAEAYEAARQEVERQRMLHDDPTTPARNDAEQAFLDAKSAMQDASVEVVFRAIGRTRYKQLKRAHPPTAEQTAEVQAQFGVKADVNVETFAPELIAASCVSPEMTPGQVASLVEEYGWNEAEYISLYQLAMRVNESRSQVDLDFS